MAGQIVRIGGIIGTPFGIQVFGAHRDLELQVIIQRLHETHVLGLGPRVFLRIRMQDEDLGDLLRVQASDRWQHERRKQAEDLLQEIHGIVNTLSVGINPPERHHKVKIIM